MEFFCSHVSWFSRHMGWFLRHESKMLDCGTWDTLYNIRMNDIVRQKELKYRIFAGLYSWIVLFSQYEFN